MDKVPDALKPAYDAVERAVVDPKNHDLLVLLKAMRNGAVYGTKVRFSHALVMSFLFKGGNLKDKLTFILSATRQHATNLATFAFLYKSSMLLLRSFPLWKVKPYPSTSVSGAAALTLPHRREHTPDSFLAGLLAGYVVFGRPRAARSSVTQQIVIYVFARVCLALAKLAIQPREPTRAGFQAGYSPISRRGPGLFENVVVGVLGDNSKGKMSEADRRELVDVWRRRIEKGAWPVFASVSWGMVMWLFRWYPEVVQPSLRSSMRYLYDDSEVWDGLGTLLFRNK